MKKKGEPRKARPATFQRVKGYFFLTQVRLVPERFFTVPPTSFCLMALRAFGMRGWGTWRTFRGLPLSLSLWAAFPKFAAFRSTSVAVFLDAESNRLPREIGTSVLPGALALARL